MKKKVTYRRNQASSSLFENTQTLKSLSKQGNPLEFISGIVDFEMFRPILEKSYKPLNARVMQVALPLTLY